jgi:ABC-type antimicrobial peptide transport system permease subunit
MRQALQQIDGAVPVFEAGTMASHISRSLGLQRAAAATVGIFGVVALMLAGIGLYGVVSFGVSQRTAEVGIRMALGARSEQVTGMLVREMMSLVGVGAALGLGLALLLAPVLRSFLFGVPPGDPLTLLAVTALLLVVSLIASWLPARHAARIGPLAALRYRQ